MGSNNQFVALEQQFGDLVPTQNEQEENENVDDDALNESNLEILSEDVINSPMPMHEDDDNDDDDNDEEEEEDDVVDENEEEETVNNAANNNLNNITDQVSSLLRQMPGMDQLFAANNNNQSNERSQSVQAAQNASSGNLDALTSQIFGMINNQNNNNQNASPLIQVIDRVPTEQKE